MILASSLLPRCRKTDSAVKIDIFESFAELPEDIQNLVIRTKGVFGTPQYFQNLEQMTGPGPTNIYVVPSISKQQFGLFHFQTVPFNGSQLENFIPENLGSGFQKAIKRMLAGFKSNILVAGNIFMTGDNGICTFESADSRQTGEVYAECVVRLLELYPKTGAFLMSDRYAPETDFDQALLTAGFKKTASEPDMELMISPDWKNFDDYLNALSTKYRTRAKRTMAKSAEVVRKSLTLEEIRACEARLFDLYRQVTDSVKLKLATLENGYFSRQKESEPEHYQVFCYSLNNQPMGLMTYFKNGDRMEVHHTGRDKKNTTDMMLYERMLLDAVAYGIECRADSLHFGRTATEVKSTIGARPKEMHGFVFHTKPIRNQLFAFMARTLKPQPYKLRMPFKMKST